MTARGGGRVLNLLSEFLKKGAESECWQSLLGLGLTWIFEKLPCPTKQKKKKERIERKKVIRDDLLCR